MVKRFPVSNVSFEDVIDWSNDFPFRTFLSQLFFGWLKEKCFLESHAIGET